MIVWRGGMSSHQSMNILQLSTKYIITHYMLQHKSIVNILIIWIFAGICMYFISSDNYVILYLLVMMIWFLWNITIWCTKYCWWWWCHQWLIVDHNLNCSRIVSEINMFMWLVSWWRLHTVYIWNNW